jgi:hypothetical protein
MHGAADEVTDPAFSQKLYDVAATADKVQTPLPVRCRHPSL